MKLPQFSIVAPALLAIAGAPSLLHAQQDASNCVNAQWKPA